MDRSELGLDCACLSAQARMSLANTEGTKDIFKLQYSLDGAETTEADGSDTSSSRDFDSNSSRQSDDSNKRTGSEASGKVDEAKTKRELSSILAFIENEFNGHKPDQARVSRRGYLLF